jgi:hypothetical protein
MAVLLAPERCDRDANGRSPGGTIAWSERLPAGIDPSDRDHVRGAARAPITLVEYRDESLTSDNHLEIKVEFRKRSRV